MSILPKKMTVLGCGFMGLQICLKAIEAGYVVKAFDPDKEAVARATKELKELFQIQGMEKDIILDSALDKLTIVETLDKSVEDAELVLEAIPENFTLKGNTLAQVEASAGSNTIIASNSSSIPVVDLESFIHDKGRILNIHFDAPLINRLLVDIMPGSKTTDEVMETSIAWVKSIGCIPVRVNKPIMGYLGNRLWRVVKKESLKLWAEGYGEFKEIDRSWMLQFDLDIGPFAMMDVVGLDVVYDIEMTYYKKTKESCDKPPQALKDKINKGELGLKTGKGFYDWFDPDFIKPGFLKGEY